ncbi:MAG TPA: hypothetical protein GX507_10845 [Clostridia bacterium]|nr:hypothetical protein [Clostridia bacterium]
MMIGCIVNPYAGGGVYRRGSESSKEDPDFFERLLSAVNTLLSGCEVMAPQGAMGEDLLNMAGISVSSVIPTRDVSGPERGRGADRKHLLRGSDSVGAAAFMARSGVEALVVIGGDGTMADAALGIVLSGCAPEKCPILGIGVGTSNVGGLISLRLKSLTRRGRIDAIPRTRADISENVPVKSLRDADAFIRVPCKGLVASADGEIIGVAFNDVVMGDTVLATIDDRKVDVKASSFIRGELEPATPSCIYGSNCEVTLIRNENGGSSITGGSRRSTIVVASGTQVGQAVVSILDGRFVGKAVSGGACLGDLLAMPAAVAVSDRPVVRVNLDMDELYECSPITTRTASFGEKDTVRIKGIRHGACVCCDGNPVLEVSENDGGLQVEVTVRSNLVYRLTVLDDKTRG